MQPKQIEVSCPCCDTILLIDTLTKTVMRQARPSEVDETGKVVLDESRWDTASDRIRERKTGSGDRFENALSKEQGREAEMDDLFEKAKRKALGG
ncbi:MAG: hypothetical protein ACI841_004429, partial [Planctomycetota bacterium]